MASEQKTCRRCAGIFVLDYDSSDPLERVKAKMTLYCETCLPIALSEAEAREAPEKARKLEERWCRICPQEYQQTDLSRETLAAAFVVRAINWIPGSKGLGFIGPSGKGKTRLLYLALRKAFMEGLWVHATTHLAFRKVAIDAYSAEGESRYDARAKLDMMSRVDVLLFDDLGKAPSTEGVDSEFEELIERRTSNDRSILWSANASGQWLIERFGPDRGDPIVRRLGEFTTVVKA